MRALDCLNLAIKTEDEWIKIVKMKQIPRNRLQIVMQVADNAVTWDGQKFKKIFIVTQKQKSLKLFIF